jgi:hypothetical protein
MISADGLITWGEYHAINDQALAQTSARPHRVDVIFNSKVGLPPGNPLPHFREVFAKWSALSNLGMVFAVEASRTRSFIKASTDITGRLMGDNLPGNGSFVATLDEAIAQIKADRENKDAAQKQLTP